MGLHTSSLERLPAATLQPLQPENGTLQPPLAQSFFSTITDNSILDAAFGIHSKSIRNIQKRGDTSL